MLIKDNEHTGIKLQGRPVHSCAIQLIEAELAKLNGIKAANVAMVQTVPGATLSKFDQGRRKFSIDNINKDVQEQINNLTLSLKLLSR